MKTMNTTIVTPQFIVIDDLLPDDLFEELWQALQRRRYEPYRAGDWRPEDGVPLFSKRAVMLSPKLGIQEASSEVFDNATDLLPTGDAPLDRAVEAVYHASAIGAELVGSDPTDWVMLSATPVLHPAGTGLSWHADHGTYAGAYIYYAHPRWNARWGGELFVAHESCCGRFGKRTGLALDDPRENEILMERGVGTYIVPKPNRLVLLGREHPHQVARVAPAAGNNLRASLAGFYLRFA
jgi:hypothetical protein